jgi:hypothetical protein
VTTSGINPGSLSPLRISSAEDMRPTLEQLSLALADSLDDRPLGMVTNDLTVGLLFGEPTGFTRV